MYDQWNLLMKVIDSGRLPRVVDQVHQSRFSNLLVGGCSFTSTDFGNPDLYFETLQKNYKNIQDSSWPNLDSSDNWKNFPEHVKQECRHHIDCRYLTYLTWPIYCRDLLNFTQVIDCSCPGAGNKHIHDSVILALESNPEFTPANTQIVIMWSGYDRDDIIADADSVDVNVRAQYTYAGDVNLIFSGGLLGQSNSLMSIETIKKLKSDKSRSVENFIYIVGLYRYLTARGFDFVFTRFADDIKHCGIDIAQNLTDKQTSILNSTITVTPSLGSYSLETIDGSHPTAQWQHKWAENILMPYLLKELK